MKRATLLCAALLLLGATAVGSLPTTQAADKQTPEAVEKAKPIDVAICLDVSGSMNGLIDSAKLKLWDIVNDLAKVKPTPELRVALYSYGHNSYDPQAGWVRKESDLTTDLDEIYRKLNALTINGGQEYVARVCRDAVDQQKWSEDKGALKIIFVAGNEPANQDKQVALKDVADKASKKGIIINTIYCKQARMAGPQAEKEANGWKEFAGMCEGQYASIDQDKNVVAAIATPHDKELAELSNKLSTTYVAYGAEGKGKLENQKAQDKAAESAAPASAPQAGAAARAASKASGLYRNEMWDLVDKMKQAPNFDVKKIPEDQLCEEMKKMKPEEREAYVKKMAAEREAMQKQIAELNAKRETYIREEMKKNPSKGDQAFDTAVRGALKKQAADKGIQIPEK